MRADRHGHLTVDSVIPGSAARAREGSARVRHTIARVSAASRRFDSTLAGDRVRPPTTEEGVEMCSAEREASSVRRNGDSSVSFANVDGDAFVETSFRPATSVGVIAGIRYEWQTRVADWNNLAPRISAAFASAGRKTVFRAGVGLFYQSLPENAVARALLFGDSGLREMAIADPSFPTPAPRAASANAPAASWHLAPGLQLPATVQTSVSAERALWRKASTAEYLLLRKSDAVRARDVNAPLPQSRLRPRPNAALCVSDRIHRRQPHECAVVDIPRAFAARSNIHCRRTSTTLPVCSVCVTDQVLRNWISGS